MSEGSDIRTQASPASEHPGNDRSQREPAPADMQEHAAPSPSGDADVDDAPVEQPEPHAPAAEASADMVDTTPEAEPQPDDGQSQETEGAAADEDPGSGRTTDTDAGDAAERENADPIRTSDELIPDFLRPPKHPAPPQPEPEDLPVRMVIPADGNEAYVMEPPSEEVRRVKREKQRDRHRTQSPQAPVPGAADRPRGDGKPARGQAQRPDSGQRRRRSHRPRKGQPQSEQQAARKRRSDTRKRTAAQVSSRATAPGAAGPRDTNAQGPSSAPAKPQGAPDSAGSAAAARKRTRVLAGAILVAVIVGAAAATGVFGPADTDSAGNGTATQTAATTASDNDDTLSADEVRTAFKKAGLSPAEANKAAKKADDDKRIAQIAANADAYKKEGKDVQTKLLALAVDDPKAVDFVLDWPSRYPDDKGQAYNGKVKKGTIPQLYQWDERWGYTTYSGTTFARTGCGPTALSMVYMGLTGKTDKTPYDMGQLARTDGYESPHNGTVGDFLTDDAAKLGLACQKLDVDAAALQSWLQQGGVVICNVGAGDFTDGGHFFVITGLDKKGKLTIHDPYSSVRSAKHWSVNRILDQTVALYGFTAAN